MTEDSDFKHDDERRNYSWELTTQMETAIDFYERDREAYWEDAVERGAPELKSMFQDAERFAQAILKAAEDLVSRGDDDGGHPDLLDDYCAQQEKLQEQLRAALESVAPDLRQQLLDLLPEMLSDSRQLPTCWADLEKDSPIKLAWEHLCVALAWDAVGKIENGAFRLLDLWSVAVRAKPHPVSVSFLRHVSRCYVWGFDSECIMLCRSVLDTTFQELRPEIYRMDERIDSVAEAGLISAETADAAHRVRVRANKAIHHEPDIRVSARDVIRDALTVLEAVAG